MDKNNEMVRPFKPGETASRAIPEAPIHMEQAFHVGERALAQRRRLSTALKVAAAGAVVVAAGAAIGDSELKAAQDQAAYDAKIEQNAPNELYKATSFYDGKLNISIHIPDDNTTLNLRNAPYVENNTIDWKNVVSIDGTNVPPGTNSFSVEDPLMVTGQNPVDKTQSADWINLDLVVKTPDGQTENERAFIFNGEQTSTHIKVLESGAIKPLSQSQDSDNIGKVTITQ